MAESGRRIAVLDDDPTGTQTVHGVPVLTTWSVEDLSWALTQSEPTFYILTTFVRARGGISGRGPLSAEELYRSRPRRGHGLVLVGSHVAMTTRQLEHALALDGVRGVELPVPKLLDAGEREAVLDRAVADVNRGLVEAEVIVYTSREVVGGGAGRSGFEIGRSFSDALVEVMRRVDPESPLAFVVAKGGITSSDIGTRGLDVRRAEVAGQMLPGIISVWILPEDSPFPGLPYIIFAGNVGAPDSLARVIEILREGWMQRLGFIGLGAMGAPMAACLVRAGFELSAFDVRSENAVPLVELGATSAASPGEAAEGADALFLMVVNAQQAEDVLFGDNGAAEALESGSAVVLMSTVGPGPVRALKDRLARQNLRLLDAPVSGGVARAERGDLLIMAGGPTDLFEELRPALEAMGSTVAHCGESAGDGQSVKLVNQLLCGIHIAAAGEALAYAEALGLDPRAVFETIRHGAANSFMLEDRGERMLEREFIPAKSALDIFVKDMRLVREAARERSFETPLSDAAHRLYETGSSLGIGREDDSGIVCVFERGTER